MKHKKFIILGIIILIIALSFIAVGTYAYFIRKAEVTNTFTVGDVNITLTEPLWEEEIDGKGLMPGTTIEFDPTLTATKGDSYARIVLEFLDDKDSPIKDQARIQKIRETLCYNTDGTIEEGKSYDSSVTTKDNCHFGSILSSNNDFIGYHGGSAITTTDQNGFTIDTTRTTLETIYFNSCYGLSETSCGALKAGEGSILKESGSMKLFSHIVIPSDWTEEDLEVLGNFKLKLTGEAIQSSAFTSSTDAYTALDAATN